MSYKRRFNERLREGLPLSSKIFLRRLFVGSVGAAVRLSAGVARLGRHMLDLAVEHGLDLERVRGTANAPETEAAQTWSASDFLLMMDALSGRELPRRPNVEPRASVIIPVFDNVERTFQCLRSLVRELNTDETEIIVVDNASRDETTRLLSYFGSLVRIVYAEEKRGFLDACNQGAAAAHGQHLVFLSGDAVVLPGWLERLLETVEADAAVGAVGSMLLHPDGTIREAGGIVWKTGVDVRYGAGASPGDRRYNFAREVDYCSGASLLVRRELFDGLGGFDSRYAPAYYEDVDLCFGVRALGFRVVYQPASRLVRYEAEADGNQTGGNQVQAVNRMKFSEKWRDALERDHLDDAPAHVEAASDRRRGPRVLVFDDHMPTPDRDAGSARMFFILKTLARWCCPVFVPLSKQRLPDYERELWRIGVRTASVVDYARLLKEQRYDVAVLSRPHVAEALLDPLRNAVPGIKIIYDIVDMHFVRLEREHQTTGDTETAREAARYRELEARLARSSDLIWCCSSEDRRVAARQAPAQKIELIPTIHPLQQRGKPFEERQHLLFIGNMLHRPNADAVHFFMREIFPLVRQSVTGVKFNIVGDSVPPDIAAYASDDVQVLGYVPNITPLFENSRVMVAPLRFGAGMKGKIGESLSYGLPVVTTSVGAESLKLRHGEEALIVDDPREYAEAVTRLYQDKELWQRLADNGYRHMEEHFSTRAVERVVSESLMSLVSAVQSSARTTDSDSATSTGESPSRASRDDARL